MLNQRNLVDRIFRALLISFPLDCERKLNECQQIDKIRAFGHYITVTTKRNLPWNAISPLISSAEGHLCNVSTHTHSCEKCIRTKKTKTTTFQCKVDSNNKIKLYVRIQLMDFSRVESRCHTENLLFVSQNQNISNISDNSIVDVLAGESTYTNACAKGSHSLQDPRRWCAMETDKLVECHWMNSAPLCMQDPNYYACVVRFNSD